MSLDIIYIYYLEPPTFVYQICMTSLPEMAVVPWFLYGLIFKLLNPRCWEPPGYYLCTPEQGRPGCVISIQKGMKTVNATSREGTGEKTKFSALYIPPLWFLKMFVLYIA